MTDEDEDCDEMTIVDENLLQASRQLNCAERRRCGLKIGWCRMPREDRVLWWANGAYYRTIKGDDEEDCFLQDDTLFFLTSSVVLFDASYFEFLRHFVFRAKP